MTGGPGALTVIFLFLVFLIFGYILVLSVFTWAVNPGDPFGPVGTILSLGILIPIILLMKNTPGIYENGIKVARPLYARLSGKKAFFRYEDIHAVYPAVFETSAQMMSPQPGWDHAHPYGHYSPYGHGAAAFGNAYGQMLADSGERTGLGVATDEGEFILTVCNAQDKRSPYVQMMDYVNWALSARNLKPVRVPLQITNEELEHLYVKARPIPFKWYAIAAGLALGLPFLILILSAGIVIATGNRFNEWAVPSILILITVSTIVFVGLYQAKTNSSIKARTRLNYYNLSQQYIGQARSFSGLGPVSVEAAQDPALDVNVDISGGDELWDPSRR